ncbi:hypothetical protein KU75_06480 [Pectobacterium odoriferum]|uniref:Head-tail adaptor protein n=1 Tax=Pectobacterium odoriferum TaxID=78398 RepID=A0ABR4VSM1_9GAMM|nr:hypothetical protein [Pectobacterium odoriferum]KGA42351.1 hypothetical protein KU75_06480 [Pectobacterium odoriferum]
MSTLFTGLIRPPVYIELIRPVDSDGLLNSVTPDLFREQGEPDSETPVILNFRVFRVEMNSVTRRGNKVRSIYYVRESHIITARDVAVKMAGKRGLRKVRVMKVSDPLAKK